MLGHHFETKTPATNRTCLCWGSSSRSRQRQRIVHLSARAPLLDQDTSNKSYISVLGHHFETKTPATNRTSQFWGTTSRQRHRKQIMHLNVGASLRQQIVHFSAGAPLRHHDTSNKSCILVLEHHFETKKPAIIRKSQCFGTTSRPRHQQQIVHLSAGAQLPRHRQQIVYLSAGAPRRYKDTQNKSYTSMLGHRSETKITATNRTSQCWGTTSSPRHRQ